MATAAQIRATKKYQQKTYTRVAFDVKKGENEYLKEIAKELNLSVNKLITLSVNEFLEKHGKRPLK